MNPDVLPAEESPATRRPRRHGVYWLIAVGLAVLLGFAVANPGEQAHRNALGNKPFCRYHNYLLFSSMTTLDLGGQESEVSTGFLGTVTVSENANAR